ncbi:phage tail fiber protein [Bradyrhizobium sp.]
MGTITSADSILVLSQPILFPTPQQIQGFAADDIFDIPEIQSLESTMGVDGVLSFGFVFVEIPWDITLQADSISNLIFDTIWSQQQATKTVYPLSGFIKLPSISTKFTLTTGGLKRYKPAPGGGKTLKPRKYGMVFQNIAPAPA